MLCFVVVVWAAVLCSIISVLCCYVVSYIAIHLLIFATPQVPFVQDPIMEVRHQFALKVHQMVQDFQKDPCKGHKAAKWAAVFSLAAMDPTQTNCRSAYNFLMEFVAVRR